MKNIKEFFYFYKILNFCNSRNESFIHHFLMFPFRGESVVKIQNDKTVRWPDFIVKLSSILV